MTQFKICAACVIEKRGIKTRISVDHTCVKADKNYKEPESIICPAYGKQYKIYIHQKLFGSQNGCKYSIVRNQYLNGYKVPAGSEIWVPHDKHTEGNLSCQHKYIWVRETFYQTLAFV